MENERACGECTACCMGVLAGEIHGIQMGKGVPCYFLDKLESKGCSIYDDRPKLCRSYNCSYLLGEIPESFRPDKCGVLIDKGYQKVRAFITRLDYNKEALAQAEELASRLGVKVYKQYRLIRND